MRADVPIGRRLPLAVTSITDVAERQLCTGCGVCAFVQPDDITMVDDPDAGRRPLVRAGAGTDAALAACPGIGLEHGPRPAGVLPTLWRSWGPVLEVWEGHAVDADIRYLGSSGGAATALALSSLEADGLHGVLHTRARADAPILNETVLSRDRGSLLAGAGSRYAPASPCDGLELIRSGGGPSVFIGKPCDVAATARARRLDPDLDAKVGLTIAIFCAGTPTLRGTLEMLEVMGVRDPADVERLDYRGRGWPGQARATLHGRVDGDRERTLSYDESWGDILERHRQWRCYVCLDHTGEFADLSVGDPWYRDPEDDALGSNLILVRTERGRRALASAIASGFVAAARVEPAMVPASQPGLRKVRGAVWGRIAASRVLRVPAPVYRRMPSLHVWLFQLSVRERLRSTLGLVRRLRRKGLRHRHPVRPLGR